MKKVLFYAGVIALTAALAGCKKNEESSSTTITVVKIGGVTWAAANVDDYQTFAAKPDMYTKFYQWNRSKAWAATGSVSGWNSTADQSATWTANPCPAGWRLPTNAEFAALNNAGSSWAAANAKGNAVAGRFYGGNHATATMSNLAGCVFLPAVGGRDISNGALLYQGVSGNYWSSTQYTSTIGYNFTFSNAESMPNAYYKEAGLPIRCVQ